jgi:hypothetical protein
MTIRRIERFLATLARELNVPATAYVTGAAAAALWGSVRPSRDIDLGLEFRSQPRSPAGEWEQLQNAVDRTTKLTGIPANVAEDIDRWGMITLLDYKRSARRYKRFADLDVKLLDPVHWAIGKLTRYLDADLQDVVRVFRRQRVSPSSAASVWGRALRASPASSAQLQFRRNVEDFLTRSGRSIWGRGFDPETSRQAFKRAARIR